ncbi:MAG: nicotinate-nucleotide diphosphorylase (carboxylating) [Bacteroidetes bacterium 4484_249]|nr:MAG: nicotinate-nucleotide diphosphorylase (carboxylating) [Bacteroidetes bacterium 4484_249]
MDINRIIEEALTEDIGDGDHTSLATIPKTALGEARLVIKENGILAGVNIAEKVFKKVDEELFFEIFINDGAKVKKGDVVFLVKGKSVSILSAERLALNFMQRMSGIATYTNKLTEEIKGFNTKLLDTRKTTPLLRELEKYSVRMGGGENHRMGLYDMIMIKDNHIDFAGGINQAIESTNKYLKEKGKDLKIEIEVRNFDELEQVLKQGNVHRIMLDNFAPVDIERAIEMIKGKYETEASGGITFETIKQYAKTGVDYISVGALTHQIKSLDMSLLAD